MFREQFHRCGIALRSGQADIALGLPLKERGRRMDAAALRVAVEAQRTMIETLFDQLRRDGIDAPGVTRDPYGAGEQRAHATVARVAGTLGLEIARDDAMNLYMTLPGRDRGAPVLVDRKSVG